MARNPNTGTKHNIPKTEKQAIWIWQLVTWKAGELDACRPAKRLFFPKAARDNRLVNIMDELMDLFSGQLVSFAYTFLGTNGMADILNRHAAGRIASIFGFAM